jgi:NitT/TauT family transport system ATP-binding protein
LGKSFNSTGGRVEALQDIDLDVEEDEFICLIGPSGCGKTTLLRIIAGLESLSVGTITLNDKKISGPSPDRSMVFQEYNLFPWRNVERNVEFGLETKDIPKKERHRVAQEYINLVGLTGFERAYPYELSGGMKQRVGLARALVTSPKVLLMDEPFGSLDAQTRNLMQDELLKIWQRIRTTIIFVTHSADEAVYVADRVAVLTTRPGTIKNTIKVNIGRPRSRIDPRFIEVRRRVLEGL